MRKRDLMIIWAAVIAAVALAISIFRGRALETGSWGLSFRTQGAPPVGSATVEQLAAYDAVYLGDPGEKKLYLTFDAGYENGCTGIILDVLKKHQVSAAFFLCGNYVEKNADLVRRMAAEGHTIGNHTMHHPDMSQISDQAALQKELKDLEDLVRQTTGAEMSKFYRPPQGCYSQENLEQAKALGYKTVFWSLAYVDWKDDAQPTAQAAMEKLLPRTHNGAVILLHATSRTNAQILDDLLTQWKAQGYTFGTLEELF